MKNRTILVIIIIGLLIFCSPAGKTAEKKLNPDGIVLHSYDCPGPCGENAPKNYGSPLKNYHYIVKKNGDILKGFPEDKIIPHIGGKYLSRSLSVMVEGTFRESPFIDSLKADTGLPQKQFNSLKKLLFSLMKKHNIPLSQIERHVDHDEGQFCPAAGFEYFNLLYSMAKDMIKGRNKKTLEEICNEKNIAIPIKNARLVIRKKLYTLDLYAGKTHLRSYGIALSSSPGGDKLKEWDRKTPLGKFYICEKYPMRAWMEISYPTNQHAATALKKKIIGKATYDAIRNSQKTGNIPPHNTGMGQDVGLHAAGFPYGKMRNNSTAGCMGTEDPEAYELYYCVPLGAVVEIYEK